MDHGLAHAWTDIDAFDGQDLTFRRFEDCAAYISVRAEIPNRRFSGHDPDLDWAGNIRTLSLLIDLWGKNSR
jgi:hypothetical protein